jgi:dienelactone hydrolase
MKRISLLLFSLKFICFSYSQNSISSKKLIIDSTAINNWVNLTSPNISKDGRYLFYTVNNHPIGKSTVVIQSTDKMWVKELVDVSAPFFSGDSKKIVYRHGDSLFFLTLGTGNVTVKVNIKSFEKPQFGQGKWLAYTVKDPENILVLLNLFTGQEEQFKSVVKYWFDPQGNKLLINTNSSDGKVIKNSLQLLDLLHAKKITIWNEKNYPSILSDVIRCCFSDDGSSLAFIAQKKDAIRSNCALWHFKVSMDEAIRITEKNLLSKQDQQLSSRGLKFSKNGDWLYYQQEQITATNFIKDKATSINVDIWSYKDSVIQPEQSKELVPQKSQFAINLHNYEGIQITKGEEEIIRAENNYLIIRANEANIKYWWDTGYYSFYLYNLSTGSRKILTKSDINAGNKFLFSPRGKYLAYYDQESNRYMSYDLSNDQSYFISNGISNELTNEYSSSEGQKYPVGMAAWLSDETGILIYDNYDVWLLQSEGKRKPINITNGYGNSHRIKFRLVLQPNEERKGVLKSEPLLLSAFNVTNKENGFYKKIMTKKGNPELLTSGSYYYYIVESQIPAGLPGVGTIKPKKADNANVWIIGRMKSNEAPNYFVTNDFKKFNQLSNIQPHLNYNWLSTELISWQQFDGTYSQGILYKPEDFDSTKKYPIIFEYYEQRSYALNAYLYPEYSETSINIPWFVSRGYLVFRPDIYYSTANLTGKVYGDYAYNSVVSAAKFLSNFPWVDSSKMAINGHSFGGGETNQILILTNIFAAAAESAGVSDLVSSYLDGTFHDRQIAYELSQGRIGNNLWESQELYLKNSPVLKANKITTPMLIMHNKNDHAVPWSQGVQLYMALRRLRKRVWMLQYDEGGHGVTGKDAIDYTIRLTQFFDHYLKGLPAPKWMTVGISAPLKGVETGYDLDSNGNCGKDCKVCKKMGVKIN